MPLFDFEGCDCNIDIIRPKTDLHEASGLCTTKSYPYEPLTAPTWIRLLKVTLFTESTAHRCDEEAPSQIECETIAVNLDDNPSYAALSYTWGDPCLYYLDKEDMVPKDEWYCQCYTIKMDGHEVTVSANLYAALLALRYTGSAKRYVHSDNIQKDLEYIWIDALAINQTDLSEKSAQVALMQRIYSQSKRVFVWLGGADLYSNSAYLTLTMLGQAMRSDRKEDGSYNQLKYLSREEIDHPDFYRIFNLNGREEHISLRRWSSIFAFLNRSWFRRAWIVQELVLARKATFMYGLVVFGDQLILNWLKLLGELRILQKLEELEPLLLEGSQLTARQEERKSSWPSPPEHYQLYKTHKGNKWDSNMFSYIQWARTKMNGEDDQLNVTDGAQTSPDNLLRLSEAALLYRSAEVTEPRDKIYSLLGISQRDPENGTTALVPNYSLSIRDIYIQAAKFMIRSDNLLHVLWLVEDMSHRKMQDLPSWVPDFSTECLPAPFRLHDAMHFYTDIGLGSMHAAFPEPGVLEVRGFKVNQIGVLADTDLLESPLYITQFLSHIPSNTVMIKKPRISSNPTMQSVSRSQEVDLSSYSPQSPLEMLWRTMITDRLQDQHPAPKEGGLAFMVSLFRTVSRAGRDLFSIVSNITRLNSTPSGVQDLEAVVENLEAERAALEGLLMPGEMEMLERLVGQISEGNTEQVVDAETDSPDSTAPDSQEIKISDEHSQEHAFEPVRNIIKGMVWDKRLEADFNSAQKLRLQNRKLAIIRPGGLGLVPQSTVIDDEIWIIVGLEMPCILRPLGDNRYRFVGQAYFHGMMHGAALDGIDPRDLGIGNILLV